MSRGVIAVVVAVAVLGAICWFAGAAVWHAVLVMHGRG
jgi:hypothetical protein